MGDEYYCPCCQKEINRKDWSELTSMADHGVCWWCNRRIVNGEICRMCYTAKDPYCECELERREEMEESGFCPKCGASFAVHDSDGYCGEDTKPLPWLGNRSGNLMIVINEGRLSEVYWITTNEAGYMPPPVLSIHHLGEKAWTAEEQRYNNIMQEVYENDLLDIDRCKEFDFGIKVERLV